MPQFLKDAISNTKDEEVSVVFHQSFIIVWNRQLLRRLFKSFIYSILRFMVNYREIWFGCRVKVRVQPISKILDQSIIRQDPVSLPTISQTKMFAVISHQSLPYNSNDQNVSVCWYFLSLSFSLSYSIDSIWSNKKLSFLIDIFVLCSLDWSFCCSLFCALQPVY